MLKFTAAEFAFAERATAGPDMLLKVTPAALEEASTFVKPEVAVRSKVTTSGVASLLITRKVSTPEIWVGVKPVAPVIAAI
jgi:hypothetical protein